MDGMDWDGPVYNLIVHIESVLARLCVLRVM
jgi:hypothetical protein